MSKPRVWWPLDYIYVTGSWANSPDYYKKYNQRGHNGIDLRAPVGTPVYAIDDGTVYFEGWGQNFRNPNGDGGNFVGSVAGIYAMLKHSWGYSGYAHLSRTIIDKNQKVKRGQLIGYSGATGGVIGAHLHFEVLPLNFNKSNGFLGRVNPQELLDIVARNTPDMKPNQRKVGKLTLNVRTEPRTDAPTAQAKLKANTVYDIEGWVTGARYGEYNLWYKVGKGYAWSGGFTTQTTDGLPDLNHLLIPEPVEPEIPVVPEPVEPETPIQPKPNPEPEIPEEEPIFEEPLEEEQEFRMVTEIPNQTPIPDNIMSAKWRNRVYSASAVVGLGLAATGAALTAMQVSAPTWLLGVVAAYGVVAAAVNGLSKANTPKQ